MEPGMGYLGSSFAEAADLQQRHLELAKNLLSKQSPVEDLLRQADDQIAHQALRRTLTPELIEY